MSYAGYYDDYELYHHGIKGQKWGVRRYQNEDGSYTSEGKRKYGIGTSERVRARQAKLQSKLDSRKGRESNLFLNKNDYLRGRISSLDKKATHREARQAYRENRSAENLQKLRSARTNRVVSALTVGGTPITYMSTAMSGSYSRYKNEGKSTGESILRTAGKYAVTNMSVNAIDAGTRAIENMLLSKLV